ncbi:MAG: TonB-dependent receptor plug domain-containing protein [Saprospiraceae bacterium]
MKSFLSLLCIVVFPSFLLGQTLYGKISDSEKMPIAGAYVLDITADKHTHSSENGGFVLNEVQPGDTLQVIYLGYKTKEVVIQDIATFLDIELSTWVFQLDEVIVGRSNKSINLISGIDLRVNPVNSSQEILRKIPGLFIGQHAGGGKAEQIFLRGFDIDHGTDINISVDGMPVNMVSHAHGQGYADLHFVIPETIDKIDFGKGPYYANKGNFGTAGYMQFQTKERLDKSSVKMDVGRFNTFRTVGLFDLLQSEDQHAYIATEYLLSDGPFISPQNFNRLNLLGKYTTNLPNDGKLTFQASHFSSRWDASGQVPLRAIAAGQISRFGAIDDTEGGNTSRTNLALSLNKTLNERTFVKSQVYYSLYDFELYSNFTFFLRDPENGDQIRQKEKRQIFGMQSEWNRSTYINNTPTLLQAGVGLRSDNIKGNELSYTRNRITTLERIQLGDVMESNVYGYLNTEFDLGNWLINPGVRLDYFNVSYVNELNTTYQNQTLSQALASPKLNIIYTSGKNTQFFLKSGYGFHSNDTRVVLNQGVKSLLPTAFGVDIGTLWKPAPRLVTDVALWYLFLEQEFVYVGDEGVVEPSGRTKRIGIDVGLRYQMNDWLFVDADLNYALPRSIDEPEGAQYIPLAPTLTFTGGLSLLKDGFSAGLRARYLKDRPANEDNSIIAKGYLVVDFNVGYKQKNITWGVSVENLLNTEWAEAQFATQSRLNNEGPEGVEEIHFTPGTPFFLKGSITYEF